MSGLTISVAEILGRPGIFRDLRLRGDLEGVTTSLARLDPPRIEAILRAEAVMEGVLVTGDVTGEGTFTCARCLEEFPAEIGVEVCELYSAPDGHREKDDDSYPLEGTDINLEPMLRDVVTLSLPLNPHCADDCQGLCSRCGNKLVDERCDCVQDERDPRWAGLDALKDRLA